MEFNELRYETVCEKKKDVKSGEKGAGDTRLLEFVRVGGYTS